MEINYLAFILPGFVLLCALEYYLSLKKEGKKFRFNETISNLNVGIFERTSDLFTTAVLHFFYVWLYEHFALFSIPSNFIIWLLLFLVTDLLWYWYHRFGHRVNLIWSAHVIHHQSEDFNFTVSARVTIFQAFFRSLFWGIIPVLGFPPQMMTTILLIHAAYPFFTHTQLIGKLGILEKFLVTPSHHRVHHSSNEKYLDKNFGDVLIIWDKLFGTFIEEDPDEKPVYGITEPLKSYSFLWQHFHFVAEIALSFKRAKGWKKKFLTIFGPPEHIEPTIRKELEAKLLVQGEKQPLSKTLYWFVIVNTLFSALFVFFFLLFGNAQNPAQLLSGGLFVLISVIHTGAVLEQRKWIFHIEFFRLLALSLYVSFLLPYLWFVLFIMCCMGILIIFYNTANKNYMRLLTIDKSRI